MVGFSGSHLKSLVTFKDKIVILDDQVVEIHAPDPSLLALHASCAKIAHKSGAIEYLRELYRETDSIAAMTEPNAAQELARALRPLQVIRAPAQDVG